LPYQALKMSEGSISVDTIALIARSKFPAELRRTRPKFARREDSSDVEVFLEHGLDRDRQSLNVAMSRTTEVEVPDAVGVAGFLHQAAGFCTPA